MTTKPILQRSFLNSLGVVVYVSGVATIMRFGSNWFGQKDTYLTGVAVLLLLCVSAAIVGGLVFGYPLTLFLNGQKREAFKAAMMTIAFLAGETIAVLVAMVLMKSS